MMLLQTQCLGSVLNVVFAKCRNEEVRVVIVLAMLARFLKHIYGYGFTF